MTVARLSVGVVLIGRNEGARLVRCLESVCDGQRPVVYVDSGSTDQSVAEAQQRLASFDPLALVLPLVLATKIEATGTLASAGDRSQQLTRVLRNALHGVLHKLQFGQVMLATVGSTAPFVGLLGTVWGIYHALGAIAQSGQMGIDKVAGPVGEALVMTAAGLAVAIPAVLAYNVYGRLIGNIEADLEGFARDLRELLVDHPV